MVELWYELRIASLHPVEANAFHCSLAGNLDMELFSTYVNSINGAWRKGQGYVSCVYIMWISKSLKLDEMIKGEGISPKPEPQEKNVA